MSNKQTTVRELFKTINEDLAANFAKPVIDLGYSNYDGKNGRSVVSLYSLCNTLQDLTGLDFYEKKTTVTACNDTLIIKTKRKKSGITGKYDYADKMTAIEIFVEDESILDKTIQTIEQEYKVSRKEENQAYEDGQQEKTDTIVKTLKNHGMSLNEFKSLMYAYNKLNWQKQDELKELMEG